MKPAAPTAQKRATPAARRVRPTTAALSVLAAVAALALAQPVAAQLRLPAAQPPPAPAGGPEAGRESPRTPLAALLVHTRELLAGGQAEQAFRALDARVGDYGGEPDFDYLLGLAALDTGRPGQAVLALERVLMRRPDSLPARAEIARAYFAIRERENARREFEIVAAQRIPDEARRVIGQYLDAIRRVDDAARTRITGTLELETGRDSNVNFGSSTSQWVLAGGTVVTPFGGSLPQASAVAAVGIGLNAIVPMSGGWHWTAGGRASLRTHPSAHTLDQGQLDLSSGFAFRTGCHQFNMLAQLQHLRLDAAAFRNALGALGQWQCDVDARTQVGAYVQGFGFDFPGAPVRDARRAAAGMTLARAFAGERRPVLVAGLQAGTESSRPGLDHLSHGFRGLRAALNVNLGGGWRGSVAASWESRAFRGAEPLFGVVRHDRQTEFRLGAERALSTHWSVAPALAFTRNRSTLAPNDFRRTQAGVTFRYRFE